MLFELAANEVLLNAPARGMWLHFQQPLAIIRADRLADVLPALEEIEAQVQKGRYAAGFLAYEAAPAMDPALRAHPPQAGSPFPLLWFGIYGAPALRSTLPTPAVPADLPGPWVPSITSSAYEQAIQTIKEHIARGDTYQVNFTYRLHTAGGTPYPVFATLVGPRAAPYAAFLETTEFALTSLSPELFFDLNGQILTSRPMKGTAPRGRTLAEDQALAAWLHDSEKNRAENIMITDMVRSDMGRVARVGSVLASALFQLEKYPTVWQMTSTVRAETRAPLPEILRALFPAASITGAPKVRTSEIIFTLETSPRQVYTGAIGYYGPDRQAQFNVAIRTLSFDLRSGQVEYGVGGGIVWDSNAQEEWEETRTKARVLHERPQPFQLIETMRWTPSESWFLLKQHLDRLQSSAQYFDFTFDVESLPAQLDRLTENFAGQPQRVRLELARDGQVSFQCELLAGKPNPTRVGLARAPISYSDRFLYHKTTRREVYRRAQSGRPDCEEVLLWNQHGEITEATIANVIFEIDGRMVTPPLESGLLPGTYRQWMLDNRQVEEAVVRVEDLGRCQRVWLVNSVRGMWEVQVVREAPNHL